MRPSFFIFSLPRSGSSWLSVFLSGADSYCYHEPTADARPSEWVEKASKRPESIVGAVDTGAYLYPELIREVLPWAACFILLRDPDEIDASARKCGIAGYDAHAEREKLLNLPFRRIQYQSLRNLDALSSLWVRVIGSDFDRERAQQLIEMNVQRNVDRFMAKRAVA